LNGYCEDNDGAGIKTIMNIIIMTIVDLTALVAAAGCWELGVSSNRLQTALQMDHDLWQLRMVQEANCRHADSGEGRAAAIVIRSCVVCMHGSGSAPKVNSIQLVHPVGQACAHAHACTLHAPCCAVVGTSSNDIR
jgi:hypothetical protein